MIRKLIQDEHCKAADLSYQVCMECGLSDFTQEGIDTFKSFVYDASLMKELDLYGAFESNRLIGVIGVNRQRQHLSLFFVQRAYHRKGVGRALFDFAMNDGDFTKITVNSSTYAESFYTHLGFKRTGEKECNRGITSVPMLKEW